MIQLRAKKKSPDKKQICNGQDKKQGMHTKVTHASLKDTTN